MKKRIEIEEKCQSCNGTGLYVGMGERHGAAVVCSKCKGTGKYTFIHEYEDFVKKSKPDKKIRRVYKLNPGICIGENEELKLEDFGGMEYDKWKNGEDFPDKSEMRKYSCPAWWYQLDSSHKKPEWDECGFGRFSDCQHFHDKENCWKRFDKETAKLSESL